MAGAILLVEDERALAGSVARSLERAGYRVDVHESAEAAEASLRVHRPDLVLLDLRLPGRTGMELLRDLRAGDTTLPVVVMSAHADFRSAVEAMRLGARDYLAKPVDLEELELVVARAMDHARLVREVQYFRDRELDGADVESLLHGSPGLRAVVEQLRQAARAERPDGGGGPAVLFLGETGAGKGVAARALHRLSPRARGPFINVSCSALPQDAVELELFGCERGALGGAMPGRQGLFAAADGGTLFLDEVSQLGSRAQNMVLKAVEEKTVRRIGSTAEHRVDVRVVAATNRDLDRARREGAFLPELYHRLRGIAITLPPLRDRGDDAVTLAARFATEVARDYGRTPRALSTGARAAVRRYAWPGNVRELRHVIERAVLLETGAELALEDLGAGAARGAVVGTEAGTVHVQLPPGGVDFAAIERAVLEQALAHSAGNVTAAARRLRLSRDTLRYRMERLGIEARDASS
jgi:DNA-binding NtrC family response regulator